MLSVRNLQLSVGKFQVSAPPTFLTHDATHCWYCVAVLIDGITRMCFAHTSDRLLVHLAFSPIRATNCGMKRCRKHSWCECSPGQE